MRAYLLGFLTCISWCCTDHKEQGDKAGKPNIILIMADDQGWGDLSFHGNTNLSTPNIDAIAKAGISFDYFYVQPVCSPTRAEVLTGRHFTKLGVYDTSAGGERLNLGETTIADVFKMAGYATAAYGKWHNGMQPPYHPNSRGFDDFYGFASGHWGSYFNPMLERNGDLVRGSGYLADDLTNKGLEFIEAHQSRPFFLYLPLNTPHSPMQVPDLYWERFKNRNLLMHHTDSMQENSNFTKAALAMVENIDYNVGRITEKLEQVALTENTILVYLSDNGPNGWRWNGGMRGKKGSTDEGGVRSPLFIQWKNTIPPGITSSHIASGTDLLPTLTALAGVALKTASPIDGKDLSPLFFNQDTPVADRIIINHWSGATSLRTQNFRLDHDGRLYEMNNDPAQQHDVSALYPQELDSLLKFREAWLSQSTLLTAKKDNRPLTLGHPAHPFTQLPARDGTPAGAIKRSNRFPNCSFFTNWKRIDDSIQWDVEVLESGLFEVTLYYTCAVENIGTTLQLEFGEERLVKKIVEAHDPPLLGMEDDRDLRIESYIKDFKPIVLGALPLKTGHGPLTLSALEIPGNGVVDVRMLLFKRLN